MKQKDTTNKPTITKSMTIGLTEDGQAGINISPTLTATEAYQLLGTLTLHILNAYYKVATTQLTISRNSSKGSIKKDSEYTAACQGIKESMYDAMDTVISNVLTQFYPEAPKSSLEDEAILQLTNQLIEERYNALSDKEKAAFRDNYNRTMSIIAKHQELQKTDKDGDEE